MYNVQMYVLDSIFGQIRHPFLKYKQNMYAYVQHGSLMIAIIQDSTIVYIQGYTSKMPTKIWCWDNWLKHVCTLHVRVYTLYVHVLTLYIGIKYFMLEPLGYFPPLSCLYSLHEVLYYASVQESWQQCVWGGSNVYEVKPDCGSLYMASSAWVVCQLKRLMTGTSGRRLLRRRGSCAKLRLAA